MPPGAPPGRHQARPGPCTNAQRVCGEPIVRGVPSGTPHPGEGEVVGKVNRGASAIQVVTGNTPQRVRGVSQQAPEGGMSSLTYGSVDHTPPGRPQAPLPTHARSGTWQPRPPPAGHARRKASRSGCGPGRSEEANAPLSWGGEGSHAPSRTCADVRRVSRCETESARRHLEQLDGSHGVRVTGTRPHGPWDWQAIHGRTVFRWVRRRHRRIAAARRCGKRGTVHA